MGCIPVAILPSCQDIKIACTSILKENQLRMWDVSEYELAVPGRPTRARRVSVGRPGTASLYSRMSHIQG